MPLMSKLRMTALSRAVLLFALAAAPAAAEKAGLIAGGVFVTEAPPLDSLISSSTVRLIVTRRGSIQVCSGVVLSTTGDGLVATASHCLWPLDSLQRIGVSGRRMDTRYAGSASIPRRFRGPDTAGGDVGYVTLDFRRRGVPRGLEAPRSGAAPQVGDELVVAGWGRTDPADPSSAGALHKKALKVYEVSGPLIAVDQRTGGICFGDSGGAAFQLGPDKVWRLAGIISADLTRDGTRRCHEGGLIESLDFKDYEHRILPDPDL